MTSRDLGLWKQKSSHPLYQKWFSMRRKHPLFSDITLGDFIDLSVSKGWVPGDGRWNITKITGDGSDVRHFRFSQTKQRESQSPLYAVWRSMIDRCYNPTHSVYHYYGGKGAVVCEEWLSYSAFKTWAAKAGWVKGKEIHRCKNEAGYCPENCSCIDPALHRRLHHRKRRKLDN